MAYKKNSSENKKSDKKEIVVDEPIIKEKKEIKNFVEKIEKSAKEIKVDEKKIPEVVKEKNVVSLANKQAFEIISGPEKGYWKIGRHFTKKPTIIPFDKLTEKEIEEIKNSNPLHIIFKIIDI